MRTDHLNLDSIYNITYIPESINKDWEHREATESKFFLGFIRTKKGTNKGWYSTDDYYEEYFPTGEALVKQYSTNQFNGIWILRKPRVIIRMNNKHEFIEYWKTDEEAKARVAELEELMGSRLVRLHDESSY